MKKKNIIAVVEDDAPLRDAMDNLLRSSGFETRLFASADDFLRTPDTEANLVVTDVRMPGTTGLELQAQLRTRGDGLPVIVVTALLDDSIIKRAHELGAIACLLKPFDEATLLGAIDLALARDG